MKAFNYTFHSLFNNFGLAIRPKFVVIGFPFLTVSWWRMNR